MKNQRRSYWKINGILVILLGVFAFIGNAQTVQKPKTDFQMDSIKKAKEIDNDRFSYSDPMQMPQFPGGEAELLAFIQKNLNYPRNDGNGIPGRVTVRFLVTETGSVTKVEVLRSLDPGCDKEAIRVVKLLPNFIPGKQNRKNAAFWYTLPVIFKRIELKIFH